MTTASSPFSELILATSNPGKLREFRAILADLPVALRSLADFPGVRLPGEGDDYQENAAGKARAIAAATGRAALADDSGIEVAALGGLPGPHSARFGGPALDDAGRVKKLLADLAATGESDRSARFVCVAALALPDGEVITARGECAGRILDAPRGGRGFGYDPIFQAEGKGESMAELPPAEKDLISHRARALRSLHGAIQRRIASASS
jgi:XTP/dITP diphosphohydrolase